MNQRRHAVTYHTPDVSQPPQRAAPGTADGTSIAPGSDGGGQS